MNEQADYDPTERTLYQEPHDDRVGTWDDRMFERGDGPRKGIGIDVAGTVYVLPLKVWHSAIKALVDMPCCGLIGCSDAKHRNRCPQAIARDVLGFIAKEK